MGEKLTVKIFKNISRQSMESTDHPVILAMSINNFLWLQLTHLVKKKILNLNYRGNSSQAVSLLGGGGGYCSMSEVLSKGKVLRVFEQFFYSVAIKATLNWSYVIFGSNVDTMKNKHSAFLFLLLVEALPKHEWPSTDL